MTDAVKSVLIDGEKYYKLSDLARFLGYTATNSATILSRRYKLRCRRFNQRVGDSKDEYYITAAQAQKMCAAMNPKNGRGVYAKHRDNIANLRNYLKAQEAS